MKPDMMYEITKDKIKELDNGKGIIMLVDMGSLSNFGVMIKEETGIDIRTIDMVTTLTVLDIARKAMMDYSIDEIMGSISEYNFYNNKEIKSTENPKIIITACFTGEGSSVKIGNIVKEIVNREDVNIIPMNIIDEESFEKRIVSLKKDYSILAVISTIDFNMGEIPLISAMDILTPGGKNRLVEILENEDMYINVGNSIKKHLLHIDGKEAVNDIKKFILRLEDSLELEISPDVKMGMTLHICFLIDNIISGGSSKEFDNLDSFLKINSRLINKFRVIVKEIEDKYGIRIKDNEMAYILKMFIENNKSV